MNEQDKKINELNDNIKVLRRDFQSLSDDYYKNNFSSHQDFNKSSVFTTSLKVPHYDSVPAKAEVGMIIENSGKLLICSSPNTFVIVGTQT